MRGGWLKGEESPSSAWIPSGSRSTSTNGSFDNQTSNTLRSGARTAKAEVEKELQEAQPLASSHSADSSLIGTVEAARKRPIRKRVQITRRSNQERKIHFTTVLPNEMTSVTTRLFFWLRDKQTNTTKSQAAWVNKSKIRTPWNVVVVVKVLCMQTVCGAEPGQLLESRAAGEP